MRLIDADKLIEELRKDKASVYSYVFCHVGSDAEDSLLNDIEQMIENQPTIEAVPVVHGGWIFKFDGPYGRERAYCSACGNRSGIGGIESNQRKPYCPNCGAKMKGGKE